MKKMSLLSVCLTLFCNLSLFADDPFHLDLGRGVVSQLMVDRQFLTSETIAPFRANKSIIGLSINGTIAKESEDYLVRIIMIDKKGDEYLIMESYELINDSPYIILDNYCEETALLDNVIPHEIKVVLYHARIYINNICYIESMGRTSPCEKTIAQESINIKKKQVAQTVERINNYISEHNKLWIACETRLSLLPWKERKKEMNIRADNCYTWGFEYYGGGIIDIGFTNRNGDSGIPNTKSINSAYVASFDWRNRHGINWMTPIRDQITDGACWAFSAVGVVEALANLYYNNKIDLDLSEQEVISCTDDSIGTIENGGWSWKALGWIADNGVSDEDAFPYSNTDESCSNIGTVTEHVYINDTVCVANYYNNTDTVKKYLIAKGPMTSGIKYWYYNQNQQTYVEDGGHAMVLTGFDVIVADSIIGLFDKGFIRNKYSVPTGSDLIGKNYWIFKNSLNNGNLNSHNGYAYVYFYDDSCFRMPYYATTPVYSIHYSNIECIDRDGDGYYTWGVGSRPSSCPSWVPSNQDGDDSNPDYGPLDQFGNLTLIDYTSQSTITGNVFYNNNITISSNTVIMPNAVLTITGTVTLGTNVKLTIRPSATLIINGGTLQNADLLLNSGCHIIVNNGGHIYMKSGRDFYASKGSQVDITNGTIQ